MKFTNSNNADIDARRYLNAAGILPGQVYAGDGVNDYPLTSERIIKSVTNLHTSLKAAGLYGGNKIRHMYAFLGNGNSNLINLMYPGVRDLVPVPTTVTNFTRAGSIGGSNTMFNTGIRLSEFDEYSISAGVYLNGTLGGHTFGTTDIATGTKSWGLDGANPYFKTITPLTPGISTSGGGLFVMNQTAVNRKTAYVRGVQTILDTTSSAGLLPNSAFREIWLSQINYSDTVASGPNISGIGFFFLSTGLSDADNVALNPIIDRFMFEIRGRDSNAFLYDNWQFLGDSITVGFNGTGYHRWTNQICAYNNARELNYAVSNTMITACDTSLILPKDANHTKVFIAYSTNDFYYDYHSSGSMMNIPLYISTYATKIAEVVAKGYSLSDIIIIAAYYTNAGQYGIGADALHDQYAQAAFTIAANAGIPLINVWNWKPVMIANGAIPATGDVHPTNFGHDIISADGNARMDYINSL